MITIKSLGFMNNLTWIVTKKTLFFLSKRLEYKKYIYLICTLQATTMCTGYYLHRGCYGGSGRTCEKSI